MINPEAVLAVEMNPDENDAGALSIRGYLVALLTALWEQKEGFGGKRPFGNSGWDTDLLVALGRAGIIEMDWDEENGWLNGFPDGEEERGERLIAAAILSLGWVEQPEPPLFVAVAASALDEELEQDI